MNSKQKIILGAMVAVGLLSPVFALVQGSSPNAALQVIPGANKMSRTVSLVEEVDDSQVPNVKTGYYCYNIRLTLTRGNQYTFTVKLNNNNVYDAMLYFPDSENDVLLDTVWNDPDVNSGAIYQKYIVRAVNWESVSASTVTMYAYFYGERGGQATFTYQAALDIERGLQDNPEQITVSTSGTQTKTVTLKDVHWGEYHFIADLTAGTKYTFRTIGGSETAGGMDLNVWPYSYSVSYPETNPLSDVDAYNGGYSVIPVDTGTYEIVVYSATSTATLQYGGMPARRPSEHSDIRPLVSGVRQTCVPGKKHADGSPYYDEVIDTQLFSFSAPGKGRYLVETDGAVALLLLEAYDGNGTLLAANSASSTNDTNCRIAFEVPAAGTYYVGLCEDMDDPESYAISELPVGITLRNITGMTDGFDEFDPGDDTVLKASPLSPPLTSDFSISPNLVDVEGHGPHRLSANDWTDTFVVGCRAGLQYDVQFASSETNGNMLAADVFTLDGNGSEVPVDSRFFADTLSFIAYSNAAHYVRLYVMSPNWETGYGLEYPDYTAHCVARSETAAQYGYLTVDMRGPSTDSGATWRITGGTSATEPPYPFGSTITEKGTITITPSDVAGFSAPNSKTVTIQAGVATNLLFMYNDSYDSGDDTQGGAVALTFSPTANALDRTLWTDDPADWFRFTGVQGVYYNIRFAEKTGTPRLSVVDASGNLLAQSDEAVSVAAPQAGTYYIKIDHGAADDASYRLSYNSVNVGTAGFVNGGSYTVSENDAYIDIPVSRSSAEGAISIRYGTVAGTATAGEDYSPASGVLAWADGESAAKSIRINLLPELRPVYEGNEQLYLKIEAGTPENEGEYAPVLSAPDVATITITDSSSPAAAGTVSLALAGDGKAAISNASVRVAPGEAVRLWLTRTGGSNGDAGLTVAAIDGTAKTGQDYFGTQTQKIAWASGETGDRCVMFTTSGDVKTAKTFTVKIMDVTGSGAEPPAIGTRTVSVVIDPSLPFPDYGGTALQSAAGTFDGILRERLRFGSQSLAVARIGMTVTESRIQATLTMGGVARTFTGTGFDSVSGGWASATLSNVQTIDGIGYTDTLAVKVRMAPLAGFEEGFPVNDGEVSAVIHLPNADGITADEYLYSGVLRRDNASIAAFASSVAPFAGKYTVALVPRDLPLETEPKGLSTLSVAVAPNGSVSVSGALADGTEISASSTASVIGTLAQAGTASGYGVAVPVYFGSASLAFGGELSILHNGGTPVVHYSGTEDGCFVLASSDTNTTQWATAGFSENLIPVGGWYDDSANPAALAIGMDCSADSGEWPLLDTNDLSCVSLTTNANGVVSGNLTLPGGTYAVKGVVLMNKEGGLATLDDLSVAAAIAVPTAMGARTWQDSYPLYVRMSDTDPDWTEDFGLSATITFNGNGNTGGYAPAAVVAPVKSTEFIPDVDTNIFTRTGYEFVGWRDEAGKDYVDGDEFEVPVSNTTLTAVWTFSVAGVPEALDCASNTDLVFVAGGDAPWIPQTAVTHDSPSAIQSGAIGNGGTTWIEARVSGSGRLSFWYKVSCISAHSLTITIDGTEEKKLSGNVDWTEYVKEFTSGGIHTIRWTYTKASYGWDDGSADKAWVDQFAFGPTVTVTFDPTVGTMTGERSVRKVVGSPFGTLPRPESATMTFDYWRDGEGTRYSADTAVPDHDVALTAVWKDKEWEVRFDGGGADSGNPPEVQTGLPNDEIVLPGPGTLSKTGYEFIGWSDGTTIRTNGATYVIGTADVTMTAQWSLSVAGIGAALGNANLTFSAGGDAAWYPQTAVVLPAGSDAQAVRSGAIGNGGTTWLETQVSGSGRLSFWYKVSCISVHSLTITIDGTEEKKLSGNVDWTEYVKEFTNGGTHTIRWTYTKASYGWDDGSADAAWIDELQFGPTVTATFDPAGGTVSEASRLFVVGATFGSLPTPTLADSQFVAWTLAGVPVEEGVTEVPATNVTLVAQWKYADRQVSFAAGEATGTPPAAIAGQPFTDITLPGQGNLIAPAGYVFVGWSDGTSICRAGDTFTIGTSNVTLTAQWSYAVDGYAEALGCDAPVYTAGGYAAWRSVTDEYDPSVPGNASSLRSGTIPYNTAGSTWCQAQVSGSGYLSFKWKLSALSVGNCHFKVMVDGVEVVSRDGGITEWQEYATAHLDEGVHTVRWTYSTDSWVWEDSSTPKAQNCAWVDNLVWTPDTPPGYEFEIVKGAGVSDVVVSNGTALVEVTNGKFIAEPAAVLTFVVAADGLAMPVYSATFEGAACSKVGYGAYTFTVGEDGGTFAFSATEASAQPNDAASQTAAKEAIIASVDVAAAGKTLDETKAMVSGQVETILAAHAGALASDVAGWICTNGFSGADVALAKEIDVSYGLQATTLFSADPAAVITSIVPAEPASGAAVAYELTFQIQNGASGEAVAVSAVESVKAYVATLVKVSSDLSDWSKAIAGLKVAAVYESATSSVKVKVSLPDGLASAFMKVEK